MKRLGIGVTVLGLALGGLLYTHSPGSLAQSSPQSSERGGILGQAAPAWGLDTWIDANGKPRKPVEVNDYRGKWLYVYFFQAWCPGCHSHGFPTLKKVSEAFNGNDSVGTVAIQTVFEGFGSNTRQKVAQIQKRYALAMPMAHDAGTAEKRGSTLMRSYRTMGTPWAVLIDPQGRVVFNDFHANGDKVIAFIKDQLAREKTTPSGSFPGS